MLLGDGPERLAALDRVALGTRDAMRGEELLLQMAVILAPRRDEIVRADFGEIELDPVADRDQALFAKLGLTPMPLD